MKGRRLTRLVLLVGVALAVASVGFACSDREAGQTTRKAQQHDGGFGDGVPKRWGARGDGERDGRHAW